MELSLRTFPSQCHFDAYALASPSGKGELSFLAVYTGGGTLRNEQAQSRHSIQAARSLRVFHMGSSSPIFFPALYFLKQSTVTVTVDTITSSGKNPVKYHVIRCEPNLQFF